MLNEDTYVVAKKLSTSYKDVYQEVIGQDFNNVKLTDIDEKWAISFEGIDATGKQTLSSILKEYLNIEFKKELAVKINIPDYDLPSGQEIKKLLMEGQCSPALLQLKFALNRKEVQNRLILENKLLKLAGNPEKNVFIFDRWVDSGAIFKIGQMIYHDIKLNFYSIADIEESIIEGINKYKQYLIDQLILEHETLQLTKPHLKILCTTPVDIVEKRLRSRLIESGVPESEVENHLDSHEKNPDFLYVVQFVYEYIYSNPKVFFTSNRMFKNFLIIDTNKYTKEECIQQIIEKLEIL